MTLVIFKLLGLRLEVYRAVLCRIIGPNRRRIVEKTAPFGEEKVLFHHDNAPAHTSALAEVKLIELGLRTATPSTIFSRFGPGLKKLEHRWVKCIELNGDYVEKLIATFPKLSIFFWRLSTLLDLRLNLKFCNFSQLLNKLKRHA